MEDVTLRLKRACDTHTATEALGLRDALPSSPPPSWSRSLRARLTKPSSHILRALPTQEAQKRREAGAAGPPPPAESTRRPRALRGLRRGGPPREGGDGPPPGGRSTGRGGEIRRGPRRLRRVAPTGGGGCSPTPPPVLAAARPTPPPPPATAATPWWGFRADDDARGLAFRAAPSSDPPPATPGRTLPLGHALGTLAAAPSPRPLTGAGRSHTRRQGTRAVLQLVHDDESAFQSRDSPSLPRRPCRRCPHDEEKAARQTFKRSSRTRWTSAHVRMPSTGAGRPARLTRADTVEGQRMKPLEQIFHLVLRSGAWHIESLEFNR